MLSIQQQRFIENPTQAQKNNLSSKQQEYQYSSSALDKSLLALAAIGLATLSSCSKDSYYEEEPNSPIYQLETVYNSNNTNLNNTNLNNPMLNKNTIERVDTIFNVLGLTDKNMPIENIETMCNIDDTGVQHYIKLTGAYSNVIYGKGMSLLKDSSAGEVYTFIAGNDKDGGIRLEKRYDDGTVEKLNYVLNGDGTVTESQILDNNFLLEKSTYAKNSDGFLERVYPNGEKITYPNKLINISYPAAIVFNPTVTDYDDVVYSE